MAGGARRGAGRPKGSKSKVTLKRAEEVMAQVHGNGEKLAREIMSEVMNYFYVAAKRARRLGDEGKFERYFLNAADVAKALVQYQTPKIQSTALRADNPGQPDDVPPPADEPTETGPKLNVSYN